MLGLTLSGIGALAQRRAALHVPEARLGQRRRDPEGDELAVAGAVEIDLVKHEVRARGAVVDLSPTEFRLLEALVDGLRFDRAKLEAYVATCKSGGSRG